MVRVILTPLCTAVTADSTVVKCCKQTCAISMIHGHQCSNYTVAFGSGWWEVLNTCTCIRKNIFCSLEYMWYLYQEWSLGWHHPCTLGFLKLHLMFFLWFFTYLLVTGTCLFNGCCTVAHVTQTKSLYRVHIHTLAHTESTHCVLITSLSHCPLMSSSDGCSVM